MTDNMKIPAKEAVWDQKPERKRVAAYCRVSTLMEEQEGSYDIQVSHYREQIGNDPNMELVGVYGDRGVSGLKASSREGLQELLHLCEKGKVDMIITKSISRFSRKMADTIEMVRKLRAKNVAIYFEKENMYSTDLECDLILNILAALAEEESNSISQNMIRAHEQYASEGRPLGGKTPYGYYTSGAKRWKVNMDQARRIKLAFNMAYAHKQNCDILRALNALEESEHTGYVWKYPKLRKTLRNRCYVGEYLSHKLVSLTPGHSVPNKGYRDQYLIEDHHEAMVSMEVFNDVQNFLDRGKHAA